jgi:hypothetical protein
MVAKRFFYVCAGLLCLALAYHLGASSATAQTGSSIVGVFQGINCATNSVGVVTSTGDVFIRDAGSQCIAGPGGFSGASLTYLGNFWSGGVPTPVQRTSLGALKVRYR